MSRAAFLGEVQYLGDLPDAFDRRDRSLLPRFSELFAAHPWVEAVERVELTGERLRVQLRYRTPVLVVHTQQQTRVIDARGYLLPLHTRTENLPHFHGPVQAPLTPTGSRWNDAPLLTAAAVAGLLPREMPITTITVIANQVILQSSRGDRLLWGGSPGGEAADEASATVKCGRLRTILLEWNDPGRSPTPLEYDVRPVDGVVLRLVAESRGNP